VIPIQNIYYMLSYAFQVLNEQGYKNVATEQFHNVADLCAAILSKGITVQLKRGLGREYIEQTESRSSLRGKIEISESIRTRSILKRQLICSYDHFSLNSYMNRIIKTTMMFLLHTDIPKSRKKELRGLLLFFGDVKTLDIHNINWNVQYNRNNQTYRMLISICYLVVKGLLQTNSDGTTRLMDFLDEQRMSRLYEKFILEFFRKEHPMISASASQIPWVVDDGMVAMLPIMQSDILLTYENRILIIDAKYYSSTTQSRYDTPTIHSNNLYQIFTYVKNKDSELAGAPHVVSGMLLYARTDESIQPNHTYQMSGNKISVRTLDLNCDFSEVAAQLNRIVLEHFGIVV
jgi:5-methylcytosine-specific restriction enzyme subunit McrC